MELGKTKKKNQKEKNQDKGLQKDQSHLILLQRMSHLKRNPTPSYFICKNSDPEKLSDMLKIKKKVPFLFSETGTHLIGKLKKKSLQNVLKE